MRTRESERFFFAIAPALLCLAACSDDESQQRPGVDLPAGPCGHALTVVASDYQSAAVSIVGWDGVVHAAPFISSGSTEAGLSLALSGDVVAPTARSDGPVILLDRFPAGVLTLVDAPSAEVTLQLNVQTGFPSNLQDALFVGDRVFVSRFGHNPNPGQQPFDEGDDVLVIDPTAGAITARIDLTPAMDGAKTGVLPRPGRMVKSDDRLFVLLAAISSDFADHDDARVAVIDPQSQAVVGYAALPGGRNCAGLAYDAPSKQLLVSCPGAYDANLDPQPDSSALFVLDASGDTPTVTRTIAANDVVGASFGFSVAFAGSGAALIPTFGKKDPADGAQIVPDRLVRIDLASGSHDELAVTKTAPFSFGDVRCEEACGCVVADADARVLRRFAIEPDRLRELDALALDDGTGLPPRYLGAY